MSIRRIRTFGDPVLEKPCEDVTAITDEVRGLVEDLVDTMRKANGVGLAAPQIGVNVNAVVIEVDGKLHKMLNPEILESSGKDRGPEGCLSFPEISADVTRAARVVVRFLDLYGEERLLEGEGLLARAVQHELDHLRGVLFVQRMGAATRLALRKKLQTLKADTVAALETEAAA